MISVRILFQMVKADALERIRRRGFLATVAATLLLGYLVANGTIGLHLGRYRGVMNAGWVGMMMALCGTTFVSLFGFYAVKNAVERDRRTGVGQILAGTPISKLLYLCAKALSNFVVLAFVITLLTLAAILLFLIKREEGLFDAGALVLPFVLLALPSMAFTAALSVFFESTPGLRGGFGNVLFFIVWTVLLVIPLQTESLTTDVTGLKLAVDHITADIKILAPDYNGHFTLGTESGDKSKAIPLRWQGIDWSAQDLGWRLLPLGWALALLTISSLVFDRFDAKGPKPKEKEAGRGLWVIIAELLQKPPILALRLLAYPLNCFLFGRILLAELRLMLHPAPWWWHLGALGLWIFSFTQEPDFSRSYLLPCLWLWPLFLWSAMGTRESRDRTGPVLFSCPRPLLRQLPASWLAGVLVALAMCSGVLLRLFMASDINAVFALVSCALFIPTLALALGTWSGGSTAFEALYFGAWYVGPLQHMPTLDFMATTNAAITAGTPTWVLLLTCILIPVALLGRLRSLRL